MLRTTGHWTTKQLVKKKPSLRCGWVNISTIDPLLSCQIDSAIFLDISFQILRFSFFTDSATVDIVKYDRLQIYGNGNVQQVKP